MIERCMYHDHNTQDVERFQIPRKEELFMESWMDEYNIVMYCTKYFGNILMLDA